MKEITAVIRRDRLPQTKLALEELGFMSLSYQSCEGRGKQKGAMCAEMDSDMPDSFCTGVKLTPTPSTYAIDHTLPKLALFVPKRMLTMVVPDDMTDNIVQAIIKANQSGRHGDGKVFVSSIDEAIRVRTGETGCDAVK